VIGELALGQSVGRGLLLIQDHSRWMGLNLTLALIPLVLAVVLFRGRRRRGLLWWGGAALFLAFLPNAPYVMTDVIHLRDEIRTAPSAGSVVLGLLPLYGLFILAGMQSYTLCLRLVRGHLTRSGWAAFVTPVTVVVHVLCAVGVVLGRVGRLNSWDIVRPSRLMSAFTAVLDHPEFLAATLVALAAGSLTLDRITTFCSQLVHRSR
jgi:uncharacterized membrane protein